MSEITTKKYTENMLAIKWTRFIVLTVLAIIILFMAGCPAYNVYSETQKGKAELHRAEENRKITIEEAKADNEAAISQAEAMIKIAHAKNESKIIEAKGEAIAEIERAKGVAEANEIIGESLKDNDEYLQYLWVNGLYKSKNNRIYIPTEANLPILEAGK